MNLTEIQDLIKFVAKSGVTEVEIEKKDFKITIKAENLRKGRGAEPQQVYQAMPMAMPAPQMQAAPAPAAPAPAAAPAAPAAAPAAESNNYIEIKSPMIGTFYRKPAPDKPLFVEVGDTIKPGDVLCVIEAMKLFNEIEAEISGKVVKILVDDNSPIEYDQPLFLVDPS
ncbi:MAG: acetyl-CoA carboxylase biotin carboxyl carrier protein [Flavobacteriales bacterium]|nr:acetyl-CoA carboxylase biotin carboxyl carrier protein [Flavobacteriales bacterium]